MTTLQIRELPNVQTGPNATLSFDHGPEYPVTLANPVSPDEERDLEWYFEEHLHHPFLKEEKARTVAGRIAGYGHALFGQLFANQEAYTEYKDHLRSGGVDSLRFEIIGSPAFNAWHWECLHDPALPRSFALDAPMVRKNRFPQTLPAHSRPSTTLNVLLLTARPHGAQDVAYRTITRPLLEMLRHTGLHVRIDLVRPGTYEALVRHLDEARERHGVGYYHIAHFDTHGAVLDHASLARHSAGGHLQFQARFGRADLPPYEGLKGFVFMESGPDNRADPVAAEELAALLLTHQVELVVLNACQSGKQIGTEDSSLGARLLQAGAQQVLAMAYSVTVSAAENLMQSLYRQLFEGRDMARALCRGRAELWNRKGRKAYFDREIDLEDWLLPVLYENRPLKLVTRDFTAEESKVWYERQGASYEPPPLAYGFVGRDLDVLAIERQILTHNVLLIRGMGGAGKTSLLHHLAHWWQTTGLVEQVFYYGCDTQAWTCQQLFADIGLRLLGKARYYAEVEPLSLAAQKARLAKELNRRRHLLLLDNLESITGSYLAIPNTLGEAEQFALRGFLAALAGGKSLVLLGSRGDEAWLAPGTFGAAVHHLSGLDAEAASALAERVLTQQGALRYLNDPALADLLKLLAGNPLAIQVVLGNLPRQNPDEVLAALRAGNVDLDQGDPQDKTTSILGCIDYAFGNLAPAWQKLLLCLEPFASVLYVPGLSSYSDALRRQPCLADLPFADWDRLLQEAAQRGLLKPHPQFEGFLSLQPVLPFFLRSRLNNPAEVQTKTAVERAFREQYDRLADGLIELMESKQPQEKQTGQIFAGLEYENLYTALQLTLTAQASIFNPYVALSYYIDTTHDETRGLGVGEAVLDKLNAYPDEVLQGRLGLELVAVVDYIAKRQLLLKRYAAAGASYRKSLEILENNREAEAVVKDRLAASVLHQLGMVAQQQRQWTQAEDYFHKALAVNVEFNDRHSQANTYHQLGMVVQQQRQWAQAEDYCRKALEIVIEFNDRHTQAITYGQLGNMARERQQWAEAGNYLLQALTIFAEYQDEHSLGIALRNLALLWQTGAVPDLPQQVADVMGMTAEDVAALFAT